MNDDFKSSKMRAALIPIVFLLIVIVAVVIVLNVGEAPKNLDTKFTIPKDGKDNLMMKISKSDAYCREKFYNGRLAMSKNLEDWKDIPARKKLLKYLLDNAEDGRYSIGFKYNYNDDFKVTDMNGNLLGKMTESWKDTQFRTDSDHTFVQIEKDYILYNQMDATSAFICMHN